MFIYEQSEHFVHKVISQSFLDSQSLMTKTDRRIQRTRELLQKALIELIGERGYDGITIQDIVDRANVGRTTFYLHYNSKDELFVSCHEAIVSQFRIGSLHPLSREDLLSLEAPHEIISAYRHLEEARALLYSVFYGKDSLLILRRLRDWSARDIEANLRSAFPQEESVIPLEVLALYLAAAQIGLVQWWLEKRQPHTLESLAQMFHRLQRSAICEAFRITDSQ
ncbi:MAG TPA: TetR/AcrR family transcriptional regulator [Anaerolineales bacterium]|jgi:AcrR family transcriptional regulator|nr:TetR/AcrR family transcriptional regulator [Anaerolineales bacterium]